MIMGASVYAYGALAVVVLFGMGTGSAIYSRAERTIERHRRWFAALECVMAFAAALSMAILPRLPLFFVRFFPLFRHSFGRQIAAQFVAATMVTLLPSLLFGAAFPAAIGSIGDGTVRVGRTIGSAYAASTMGAVLGGFLVEFGIMPAFSSRAAMALGVYPRCGGAGVWWRVGVPRSRASEPWRSGASRFAHRRHLLFGRAPGRARYLRLESAPPRFATEATKRSATS